MRKPKPAARSAVDRGADEGNSASSVWVSARIALVSVLSAASLIVPKLALIAALLTLICFLSLPRGSSRKSQRALVSLLLLAALCASVGVLRFVVTDAVPGIVQGGKEASAKNAVSRLRELVFAEDALRKHGYLDGDHDGVGSAAFIAELSGAVTMPGGAKHAPVLSQVYRQLVETKSGSAARVGGYLYIICLPRSGGGLTARRSDPLDDELAERRFVAYAWPATPTGRIEAAFFIDEHERILISDNKEGKDPRFIGPEFPPTCDAALSSPGEWRPWMGKKPRARLPGERN